MLKTSLNQRSLAIESRRLYDYSLGKGIFWHKCCIKNIQKHTELLYLLGTTRRSHQARVLTTPMYFKGTSKMVHQAKDGYTYGLHLQFIVPFLPMAR